MTSHDESGAMVAMGSVSFSARASNLPGDKHVFELPVFMAACDESQVVVEYNGVRLCDFGAYNDFGGFGTSPHAALTAAEETITALDGINADIMVSTVIKMRPCLISDDRPFYRGAQRVNYLPRDWSHCRQDIRETEQEFVVWQNGGPTLDAGHFHDRIRQLVEADAAPSRKGELRSIIKGRRARSRADFLTIEPNN
jgi:hypothetical protein